MQQHGVGYESKSNQHQHYFYEFFIVIIGLAAILTTEHFQKSVENLKLSLKRGPRSLSLTASVRQQFRTVRARIGVSLDSTCYVPVITTERYTLNCGRRADVLHGRQVLMNPLLRATEAAHCLALSQASAVVVGDTFRGVDFCELIGDICPELGSSSPGQLHSDALPHLRVVISTGADAPL